MSLCRILPCLYAEATSFVPLFPWFMSRKHNFRVFLENNRKNIWWVREKAVLLHPLSRDTPWQAIKRSDLWTDLHKTRSSSTRSVRTLFIIYIIWVYALVSFANLRFFMRDFDLDSSPWVQTTTFYDSRKGIVEIPIQNLQRRDWSWLRMNASYRLNTCKSRGNRAIACYCCWRPAHGWVTRIQPSP